jgi:peptidoglycan/xylan/chitin deacetylase (PgdA/CDA1 family)
VAAWPGGAAGALSLSFDNLGEAAEIELGAVAADTPGGDHFTATRVLPSLLDALGRHGLRATFFVEGLNTELYPDALAAIAAAGHELGYHAWRHEQWGDLTPAEQTANLATGLARFGELGLAFDGMRPPGGQLGVGGLGILREAGLRYCSPAGKGASADKGVAMLPFQWRHVDASCVLPPLAAVREQMTGSPDPLEPSAFVADLETEIERVEGEGGFVTIVLHLFMLDWLGEVLLEALLGRLSEAAIRGDLWVAPCAAVAEQVLGNPEAFPDGTTLDRTSWTG